MDEFETYADVIDAYNLSTDKDRGISLTDYIKRNNIKIKEIEMDPIGDFEKILKGISLLRFLDHLSTEGSNMTLTPMLFNCFSSFFA